MKKIIRVMVVAFFALSVSLVLAPKAFAADPSALIVLTGFRAWGQNAAVPVDVGGLATTVNKTTSNGIAIPIQGRVNGCTYNGNMLDSDDNNSTDTNSALWGTAGDFYGYSITIRNKLMWCGNCAGVPNGEFEVDVSVNFQNGNFISDNTLLVGGVIKRGHWEGEWYRQLSATTNSDSTWFQGRSVRTAAFNPYATVVKFTFVEEPYGTIQATKHYPGTQGYFDLSGIPTEVNNALIKLYAKANLTDKYYFAQSTDTQYVTNKPNPFTRNSIDTSQNFFSARIYIPSGKYISRLEFFGTNFSFPSPRPWSTGRTTGSCVSYGSDADGYYCDTSIFWVEPSATTYVDIFYDDSSGSLSCTADGGEYYWTGWGIDPDNQAATPVIKLYDGSNLAQAVSGNTAGTNTTRIRNDNTRYPNASDTTNYDIRVPISEYFRDGQTRSITVKLAKNAGEETLGSITVGSGGCNPGQYYFPFIQAKNGNIVANGTINGQEVSSTRYGAPDSTSKYTEYLIISAVGGSGPFCSTKNYILTNTSATAGDCGNGTGYGQMPSNLFGTGSDQLYTAVENKYNSLASGCKNTSVPSSPISPPDIPTCPDGVIYKISGGSTLPSLTITKNRVTILVNGDLTLNGNIDYGITAVSIGELTGLKVLPNLTIVASGNVKINAAVSNIKGSIYSKGYINTCGDKTLPALCKTPLNVFGSLAARNGLILGRINGTSPTGHDPAELVVFNPLSAILATPGTSTSEFTGANDSAIIDPAEYQPRF